MSQNGRPADQRAEELLTDNVAWGLDESIRALYDILGQPASVMITGDDFIVDNWYGVLGEEELRRKFDFLAAF